MKLFRLRRNLGRLLGARASSPPTTPRPIGLSVARHRLSEPPMRAGSPRSQRESGFTLVEMLVVLAIVGMLTALVGPQVMGYLGRAKFETARAEIHNLETALDLFKLDVGRYPSEKEGLQALVDKPDGMARWGGPYLKKRSLPADPWDKPYIYRLPSRHGGAYDLYSSGPDEAAGEPQGPDAARNW